VKVYLIIIALVFAMISSYFARYIMQEKQKFRHHQLIVMVLYCTPVAIFIAGILILFHYNKPSEY